MWAEWEAACFLDGEFRGYYSGRKIIRHSISKQERYTADYMLEQVTVVNARFRNDHILNQMIEMMVLEGERDCNQLSLTIFEIRKKNDLMDEIRVCAVRAFFRNLG